MDLYSTAANFYSPAPREEDGGMYFQEDGWSNDRDSGAGEEMLEEEAGEEEDEGRGGADVPVRRRTDVVPPKMGWRDEGRDSPASPFDA